MLANPAVQARPGIFAGRPLAVDALPAIPTTIVPRPRGPWARSHLTFRGTRLFSALMLGWAGLILFAFGMFSIPAANELGRAGADAGLMALLGSVAPLIWALGILHLVAAVGIAREWQTWGFRLATWMLAIGAFIVAAGLVFALAGRDPLALTDTASPAVNGVGVLLWTLGLYGLVGWGLRRILTARQLL